MGGHVRRPHSCSEAGRRRSRDGPIARLRRRRRSGLCSIDVAQQAVGGGRVEKPAAARVAWCAALAVSRRRYGVAWRAAPYRRQLGRLALAARCGSRSLSPGRSAPRRRRPPACGSPPRRWPTGAPIALSALSPQTRRPPPTPRFVAVRPRPTRGRPCPALRAADRSGTHGSSLRRGRRGRRRVGASCGRFRSSLSWPMGTVPAVRNGPAFSVITSPAAGVCVCRRCSSSPLRL